MEERWDCLALEQTNKMQSDMQDDLLCKQFWCGKWLWLKTCSTFKGDIHNYNRWWDDNLGNISVKIFTILSSISNFEMIQIVS